MIFSGIFLDLFIYLMVCTFCHRSCDIFIEYVCVMSHHLSTAFQSDVLHLAIVDIVYSTNMFIMSLLSVVICSILSV
jgi:hypothetical protein